MGECVGKLWGGGELMVKSIIGGGMEWNHWFHHPHATIELEWPTTDSRACRCCLVGALTIGCCFVQLGGNKTLSNGSLTFLNTPQELPSSLPHFTRGHFFSPQGVYYSLQKPSWEGGLGANFRILPELIEWHLRVLKCIYSMSGPHNMGIWGILLCVYKHHTLGQNIV